MALAAAARPQPVLADLLGRSRVRTAALVVGFALFTAVAAQVSFQLSWTPVPITGQTFAVLLSGAVLGWRGGLASQALYVALGAVGLPFYSNGDGGWEVATGVTAGYLFGFIVAASVVGLLAQHGQDRSVLTSLPAMLAGSALIYLFGVTWLAYDLGVGSMEAMELGLIPFVIGDLLKVVAVGLLVPGTWRAVERFRH